MQFAEIAKKLKPFFSPNENNGSYIVILVDKMLRPPMDEMEKAQDEEDKYNPLASVSLNMREKIAVGRRFISRAIANTIVSRFDGYDFIEFIDNLYASDKETLISFLQTYHLFIDPKNLGAAFADIFKQIFIGLSKGDHDPQIILTINNKQKSIRDLSGDRVFCSDGKLYIDGAIIELPVQLSDAEIHDFEKPYLNALCAAYADALQKSVLSPDDIQELPHKYQDNFYQQRKAYLSAESIQRSVREVYDEGQDQFDILKDDTLDGIDITYKDDYENGYKRLLSVLKKVSDIQLTKSKLCIVRNLIGNLERKGLVHILVNDKRIKSWVDPYE